MLLLILLPLITIMILVIIPSNKTILLKQVTLFCSGLSFLITVYLWFCFNKEVSVNQAVINISWLEIYYIFFSLGLDGISLLFLTLTTLLVYLSLIASYTSVKNNIKEFLINFTLLLFVLINVFCVLDLLLFYIFFECILIPMYVMIGVWGSRSRKIKANYYFFLYTFAGSVFMLLSILYIHSQIGSTDYEILINCNFTFSEQKILWFTFFLSFAVKIPMIPLHLWLPEAHVEAPTSGSVILAGVLLKLGSYGFIRFSLPMFTEASFFYTPLVYTFSILSIIYASMSAVRQTDLKRVIAYTSVAHMNLVILGIFSFNTIGIAGAILQSLSHGFVSSALFLLIGVLYDRHKTRMIKYYSGLVVIMPLFTVIFLFFTMANLGLPGTGNFVGEFLIFVGSFKANTSVTFMGALGMIISGCYSLWLYNRISYGNLNTQYCKKFADLSEKEFFIFIPLILGTCVTGFVPVFFLDIIDISVNRLIEIMYF